MIDEEILTFKQTVGSYNKIRQKVHSGLLKDYFLNLESKLKHAKTVLLVKYGNKVLRAQKELDEFIVKHTKNRQEYVKLCLQLKNVNENYLYLQETNIN